MALRLIALVVLFPLIVWTAADAETQTFCVKMQAPKYYEKYNGAVAEVTIKKAMSLSLTVHYANGGRKTYNVPFLANELYINQDSSVSVSIRDQGNEIYFSDPERDDWFSATRCN